MGVEDLDPVGEEGRRIDGERRRVGYRSPARGRASPATAVIGRRERLGRERTVMRQISAVIAPLTAMWSVVLVGVVQCSRTTSPMRSAVRSFTGSGRSSEGGRGGPGLAQPGKGDAEARRRRRKPWRGGQMAGDEQKTSLI